MAGQDSEGNRQKLSLARALVHDPPVLLLDEPTANLDVVAASALEEVLLAPGVLTGRTVLLSTHSVEEAQRLCQRVVGLVAGPSLRYDPTRETSLEAYGRAHAALAHDAQARRLVVDDLPSARRYERAQLLGMFATPCTAR